jgi:hypothetical protein
MDFTQSLMSKIVLVLCLLIFIQVLHPPVISAQPSRTTKTLLEPLEKKIKEAREREVNIFAPKTFQHALEKFYSAQEKIKKGEKLTGIEKDIKESLELLNQAFKASQVSRAALGDLVELRNQIARYDYNRYAPDEMAKSEKYFREALYKAEEGDIRSAREEAEKTKEQYRLATIEWMKKGLLKESENELKSFKGDVNQQRLQKSLNDLRSLNNIIELQKNQAFNPLEFRKDILDKIGGVLIPFYPPFYQNLPDTLLIGEFVLILGNYSDKGHWDFTSKKAVGLSGTAWTSFKCGFFFYPVFPVGFLNVVETFHVVNMVTDPLTQISLENARLVNPEIHIGDSLGLDLAIKEKKPEDILKAKSDLIVNLIKPAKKGDILVHFDQVTIEPVTGRKNVGRIIQGTAAYPTKPPKPEIIKLHIAGFTALIDTLTLSTGQAVARINLQFPSSMAAGSSCEPASVFLGTIPITQKCEFYVEKPADDYGSFQIGNNVILVEGKGFVADFSTTTSFSGALPPLSNSWRGVYLMAGHTIPEMSGTVVSNTGYFRASYSFPHATVTYAGFTGDISLKSPYMFRVMQPFGYDISFRNGLMTIKNNEVTGGLLLENRIDLPPLAVTSSAGTRITAGADTLLIQGDADLFGKIRINRELYWGELTKPATHINAYSAEGPVKGYFYLSAAYKTPYWPIDASGYKIPVLINPDVQLESQGIQGASFLQFKSFRIFTPDIPNPTNPINFDGGSVAGSWINIVSQGVHGIFYMVEYPPDSLNLGPTSKNYYQGNVPFSTILPGGSLPAATIMVPEKKPILTMQFVNSAVYNSDLRGFIHLKGPSKIYLAFKEMQFTSTAQNAGGQVDLSTPDTLDYWGVVALQKPGFSSAGLVSVKTGQIILTAAGLEEKRHFGQPFWLSWGEILATGNLGRLFFDYNTAGQTFDGFNYAPSAIRLSDFVPGKPGYLKSGGTAHFDFFGADYLNIQDFKDANLTAPFDGRLIKMGFDTPAGFSKTDTTIARNWSGEFGNMNFNIRYDDTDQDGFIGNGSMGLNFIHDGSMKASIVLSSKQICMSINEKSRHDFTVGPVANFSSMSSIWGCACVEDGQLKRLMIGAELEATGNANIAFRSAAYGKLEYLVTPSVSELTINGNMYIALLTNGNLEVTGQARFKVDRALGYVDGDIYGKFDSSNLLGGLSAEGQVNWHLGTFGSEGYMSLQGKIAVTAVAVIGGGVEAEGGFYTAINAPKDEAWILQDENSRFRLNMSALPSRLTGLYGFNRTHAGFNIYIFSGGIETYVGLGAFVLTATQANALHVINSGFVGLPYALGHLGVHIHGEILGGLVSAGAWGDLQMFGPYPFHFEGTVGLEGCVLWVACGSVDLTVGLNSSQGFYIK